MLKLSQTSASIPNTLAFSALNLSRRRFSSASSLQSLNPSLKPALQFLSGGMGFALICKDIGRQTLEKLNDEVPWLSTIKAGDATFCKKRGWPVQVQQGGIVHRSLRIARQGIAHLALILDPARMPITRITQ